MKFQLPNDFFISVWISLYIIMAISAYRLWQKRHTITHVPRIVAIYFIQLVLNLIWPFILFYVHQPGVALFEIIALLIAVIISTQVFYKIDKVAGLLFIPYILCICFAVLLTYNIFILN